MCIHVIHIAGSYGEFSYDNSVTVKHSLAHKVVSYYEDDHHFIDWHSYNIESDLGVDGHICSNDPFKHWRNVPRLLSVVDTEKSHTSELR